MISNVSTSSVGVSCHCSQAEPISSSAPDRSFCDRFSLRVNLDIDSDQIMRLVQFNEASDNPCTSGVNINKWKGLLRWMEIILEKTDIKLKLHVNYNKTLLIYIHQSKYKGIFLLIIN